jgi:BlaI family penicillinase repressor
LPRRKSPEQQLTPLELEIMNVLWETGPANVQTVQAHIKGRELAYTTVQTMLNVLHRKGKVKRQLKDRAYVYRPVFSRQKAVAQAVGDMLDRFFGGSADSLVLNLVEARRLTPEKLAQIQELVARTKEEEHGND